MVTSTGIRGECGCCSEIACCGDGSRSVLIDGGAAAQAPTCGFGLYGNDGYDLAGGTVGTTPGGVGIAITGTTESRQLDIDFSADMGDYGDFILGGPGDGPITITITSVPEGKRVCGLRTGLANNNFGTLNSWSGTMTDTGGSTSCSAQSLTNSAFTTCGLSNGSLSAFAAAGESLTEATVSHGPEAGDDYIFIGYISLCLVDE